jgi:arylsulfatase A-like enzyme
MPRPPKRPSETTAQCAAGLLVLLLGCSKPPQPPDVVMVVMDTVRRDRLPIHGYGRDTAPHLTSLAAEAVVYPQAWSVSGWTAPAHASLFTGLYPVAHGTSQLDWTLKPGLPTLSEVLKNAGYRTVGVSENPVVSRATGFDRGFDTYVQTWQEAAPDQHQGLLALNRARGLIGETEADQPLFLFVNFAGAHNPYNSSGPFRDQFVTQPDVDLEGQWIVEHYLGERVYSAAELRHLNDLYDAEIRMVDQLVGELVVALKADRDWQNTVFIATSDHGENLGDHGHVDHVFSLYESTTAVPLIVRYPGGKGAGTRDERPVQLTDLVPTLLHILGTGAPELTTQGQNLLGPPPPEARTVWTRYERPRQVFGLFGEAASATALQKFDRRLDTALEDGFKLIRGSDGSAELYGLRTDPDERVDLAQDPASANRRSQLSARIDALERTYGQPGANFNPEPAAPATPVDGATEEALRALGYVR